MKTFAFLLSFLSVSFTYFAQDTKKTEVKEVKTSEALAFKTTLIDKGNIAYGADESFIFEFKNNGKIPIIISNVVAGCGCTTPEKPTEPIAPGKTGKIVVKYDTKRVGEFTKTVSVSSNVNDIPIIITIKGNVAAAQ